MDPLRHVKFFAATKHRGQEYALGLPYTHHLANVEAVLRRFGVGNPFHDPGNYVAQDDEDVLTAGWLHDIVEDTETSIKEVEEMFGPRVAVLVSAVTNEPGPNRKVRAALTYPKIRACPGATMLKLADRIANVEIGGNLVSMYAKEYEDFRRALYTAGENEAMWAHLDALLLASKV